MWWEVGEKNRKIMQGRVISLFGYDLPIKKRKVNSNRSVSKNPKQVNSAAEVRWTQTNFTTYLKMWVLYGWSSQHLISGYPGFIYNKPNDWVLLKTDLKLFVKTSFCRTTTALIHYQTKKAASPQCYLSFKQLMFILTDHESTIDKWIVL